jgi:hypothetical protein
MKLLKILGSYKFSSSADAFIIIEVHLVFEEGKMYSYKSYDNLKKMLFNSFPRVYVRQQPSTN